MLRIEIPPICFSESAAVDRFESTMWRCFELAEDINKVIDSSSCSKKERKKVHLATAMIKVNCIDSMINLFTNNEVSPKQRASLEALQKESSRLLAFIFEYDLDFFELPTIPIRPRLNICGDRETAEKILSLLRKIQQRINRGVNSIRKTKTSLKRTSFFSFGLILSHLGDIQVCIFQDHEDLIPSKFWREVTSELREFNADKNKGKFFP